MECGKRHYLRSDDLGRLAEALDVPADELLGIRDFKGIRTHLALPSFLRNARGGSMAQSKKGTLFPSCDERTRAIFYLHWQCLRNKEEYKRDAQECLRNLQALHDQWIKQQTLSPPPPLSPNAAALVTEIEGLLRRGRSRTDLATRTPRRDEKHVLLLELFMENVGVLQTLPTEAHRAVMLELATYWDWEDQHGSLNRYIAEYKSLIDTLECATDVFCSGDPSLESRPDHSYTNGQFILAQFSSLCSQLCQEPDFRQQFPPLAMLRQRWKILLPLAPRIPALPVLAAWSVFPDLRPHHFTVLSSKTEPRFTITLTIRPGASKEAIQAEFNNYLAVATSPLAHGRPHYGERLQNLSYYYSIFQVYNLKCAGKSDAAIAKLLFPTVFTDDKNPFDSLNQEYRNALQHVKDWFKAAKNHIDRV